VTRVAQEAPNGSPRSSRDEARCRRAALVELGLRTRSASWSWKRPSREASTSRSSWASAITPLIRVLVRMAAVASQPALARTIGCRHRDGAVRGHAGESFPGKPPVRSQGSSRLLLGRKRKCATPPIKLGPGLRNVAKAIVRHDVGVRTNAIVLPYGVTEPVASPLRRSCDSKARLPSVDQSPPGRPPLSARLLLIPVARLHLAVVQSGCGLMSSPGSTKLRHVAIRG
jgi:hypothetical protein